MTRASRCSQDLDVLRGRSLGSEPVSNSTRRPSARTRKPSAAPITVHDSLNRPSHNEACSPPPWWIQKGARSRLSTGRLLVWPAKRLEYQGGRMMMARTAVAKGYGHHAVSMILILT